jgi:uncharacterized protein (TIGR03435 family)
MAACAAGQTPAEFAAASVKSASAGTTRGHWQTGPGSITMTNVTLRAAVQWAYDLKPYQFSGPGWMDEERFDITARSEGRVPTAQLRAMMQRLLAQRFQLAIHRESRQTAGYALTVAKNGPKLRPSTDNGPAEIGPGSEGGLFLTAHRVAISRLADVMAEHLRAPVIDRTGLTGKYDFTLDLMPYVPDDATENSVTADLAGMLSTALQQQLGLKLEARPVTIDVVVVDRAERAPTEN